MFVCEAPLIQNQVPTELYRFFMEPLPMQLWSLAIHWLLINRVGLCFPHSSLPSFQEGGGGDDLCDHVSL